MAAVVVVDSRYLRQDRRYTSVYLKSNEDQDVDDDYNYNVETPFEFAELRELQLTNHSSRSSFKGKANYFYTSFLHCNNNNGSSSSSSSSSSKVDANAIDITLKIPALPQAQCLPLNFSTWKLAS